MPGPQVRSLNCPQSPNSDQPERFVVNTNNYEHSMAYRRIEKVWASNISSTPSFSAFSLLFLQNKRNMQNITQCIVLSIQPTCNRKGGRSLENAEENVTPPESTNLLPNNNTFNKTHQLGVTKHKHQHSIETKSTLKSNQ